MPRQHPRYNRRAYVFPEDALIRYTVPMPDDSVLAGRVSEKVALDASVLSTVHVGPPNWTKSRTFTLRFFLDL